MIFLLLWSTNGFFLIFLRDRLIANDFIQIRKVIEHVYEKILGAMDTNSYSSVGGTNGGGGGGGGGGGASTPAGSAPTPTGPSPSGTSGGTSSQNNPGGSNNTMVTTPSSEKGLPGSSGSNSAADRQETGSIAEDKVELLCNDQVRT